MKPFFARSQISRFEAAESHIQILLTAIPKGDSSGWYEEIDLLERFSSFTLNTSMECFFGKSVDLQLALHDYYFNTANDRVLSC